MAVEKHNFNMYRVLVVDDYKAMIRIITNILRDIGFQEIDSALDGSAAIQLSKAQYYDIIISDLEMEPLDGMDRLQWVRETPPHTKKPFILMGSDSKIETVLKAKKAGVSAYIVKPFNADSLRSKIQQIIK